MNEGSGQTVRDWSGRGNNGFLGSTPQADANDPSWIRGVFLGSALSFDGNDFVSIPDSPSLEPKALTVASWIKGTSTPGQYKYIVSKGSSACDRPSYGLYSGPGGGAAFIIGDATTFYRSPEAPTSIWDGKWHHIAGTFDGQFVRLYVDGVQIGNGTPASTQISYDLPGSEQHLGDYTGGSCSGSLSLIGDVDGVQVWSQALPVDRIWSALKALVTLAR